MTSPTTPASPTSAKPFTAEMQHDFDEANEASQSPVARGESSATMTTTKALAMLAQGNGWLESKLLAGNQCTCGGCFLCAYRHLECAAQDRPSPPAVVGKPAGAELALHINNWVIENRLPMTVLHSMQLAQHLHAAPIWPTAEPSATVDDEVEEIARKLSFAHPETSYTSFAALALDAKKLLRKLRQRAGSGVTREEIARLICREALGVEMESLYENKSDWIADRGARHDCNYPYRGDIIGAAEAVLALITGKT